MGYKDTILIASKYCIFIQYNNIYLKALKKSFQWLAGANGETTLPLTISRFGILVNNAIDTNFGDHAEASPRSYHSSPNSIFVTNGTDKCTCYVIMICLN